MVKQDKEDERLAELYGRTREAADALYERSVEILEMAQRLEELTHDTPAWYAGRRARVEARAALEQWEEASPT